MMRKDRKKEEGGREEKRKEKTTIMVRALAPIIKYATNTSLDLSNNDPDPNEVVGVTGKESLTVCGPGKRGTLWFLSLVGKVGREVGFEVVNNGPDVSAANDESRKYLL